MIDPTPSDLKDPFFEAIWQAIKDWDIRRVGQYSSAPSDATGTDVMIILTAVRECANKLRADNHA